jgi:hypothetical protein
MTLAKPNKVNNLQLLLQDVHSKLGPDYTYYHECVNAILRAVARRESASAWLDQMQRLVDGKDDLTTSHHGVLFLLQEMVRRSGKNLTSLAFTSSPTNIEGP